jgi:hypothetical protein
VYSVLAYTFVQCQCQNLDKASVNYFRLRQYADVFNKNFTIADAVDNLARQENLGPSCGGSGGATVCHSVCDAPAQKLRQELGVKPPPRPPGQFKH